jgi:hypothetical protein
LVGLVKAGNDLPLALCGTTQITNSNLHVPKELGCIMTQKRKFLEIALHTEGS